MKQWKKTVCIAVAVLSICVAAVFLLGNIQECCLCSGPSYSAPCLVDLETGDILELSLDGSSATYGGNGQSDVETFSFIRFGNITGTKQTLPGVIELEIPVEATVSRPMLCRNCKKLFSQGYDGQYVLAYWGDFEINIVFPSNVEDNIKIPGYNVTTSLDAGAYHITLTKT